MKMTKRAIKAWIKLGATDITNWSIEEIQKLHDEEEWFNEVGYSIGTYGVTGCVLQGHKTLTFYVITANNSNLEAAIRYCM